MHVFMCASGEIDEPRGVGTSLVATRTVACSDVPKNTALIIMIRTKNSHSVSSHCSGCVKFKQAEPNAQ